MNYGSLFSGIGGFSIAAELTGCNIIFHCEKDKFNNRILEGIWPNSVKYNDIKETNFKNNEGKIDILTGGDPCQPHSNAGLRKGEKDDRYLWPEMLRAIREIRPAWIINENVDGTISNGILDRKINDLEREGYACQAYSIPAESVGALHRRKRVWLIANNPNISVKNRMPDSFSQKSKKKIIQKRNKIQHFGKPVSLWPFNTYPNSERLKAEHLATESTIFQEGLSRYFGFGSAPHGNISREIIESGIIGMFDGLPEGLDYPERNKRLKALGNTIVPQLAYELFKAIIKYTQL